MCALVAAGLFVTDRMSEFVYGHGLFERPKPTVADVLDGRVADAERRAAISEMTGLSREFVVDGVTPVAEVVWTFCVEGQNSWKRQDGYRLQCAADVVSYRAWSGEFADTAAKIRARVASVCPGVTLSPDVHEPPPGYPTSVSRYECDQRTFVLVKFSTTSGMSASYPSLSIGETSDTARRVSGPSSTELFTSLSGYQWFAVVSSRRIYFEDQP